ncbi:MAG: hypothetical protein KatS3mg031_2614 [Chitinophagales bacterium]|nr:MAG: hypothetical protein KatS3mg031_2614 [Chitinophagales bacterium]
MRVRQWWSSKLPMYMALSAWLCLSAGTQPDLFFSRLALVVFWVMVTASAGYLINNYFDYEDDLRAGKAVPGQRLSAAQFILLLVVLLALSTATVAILPGYPYNLLLQVAEIGIFFAYAAPPLRLKQLPVAGLISDALYAFVIPSLIVLLSFSVNHLAAFIPWLVLWSLAAGLRNIISHHLADRKADHKAGVFNFANFAGIKTAITLHHSLLAAEIPLFILLLLHGLHAYWLIAAAAVVIMLKLFTTDRYGIHFFRRALIKNLQTGVNDFYEGWWLFFSTVLLTAKQGWFSLLLPIQFLMFSSFASIVMQLMIKYVYYQLLVRIIIYRFFIHFLYHRLIVGVLYYGILVNLWHHGILRFLYFIYSLASLTVNYSIYYYRRYVLKQDDATARRLYVKKSDSPTPAQPHKSDIHAIQDEKETAACVQPYKGAHPDPLLSRFWTTIKSSMAYGSATVCPALSC